MGMGLLFSGRNSYHIFEVQKAPFIIPALTSNLGQADKPSRRARIKSVYSLILSPHFPP